MSEKFDKPFKTYEEQIELLEYRGLIINDEVFALYLLENIGYYPLINGFSDSFIIKSRDKDDEYCQDTYLEDLYIQYILDTDIHQATFPFILKSENHFKTVLGYHVAQRFGINDNDIIDLKNPDNNKKSYLDKIHYPSSYHKKRNNTLSKIKKVSLMTRSNPTEYYRLNKNHIPPWILFRNITLGHASNLYRILPFDMKNIISSKFIINDAADIDLKKEIFTDSFEILREFRNCIAHGNRVYAFKTKSKLSLKEIELFLGPGIVFKHEHKNGIGSNDIYALFLSILILTPSFPDRLIFISNLKEITKKYSGIDSEDNNWKPYAILLETTKLPDDFISRLNIANDFLKSKSTSNFYY